MKSIKAQTIDDYLGQFQDDQKKTLEKLRRMIKSAAPGVTECISYSMPAFRHQGKLLVAFGAFTDHCSFFPMSAATIKALTNDLKQYETSKGTIRFPNTKPLPAALVKKIIKKRIAENETK
ncbi:DUF1801 domain-containing protein [bacterium]|nr:DUF1801 domain-containing protein [bacterium]